MLPRLDTLASWPRRWRCSRGFGVHSPFAYSFIHDVLREHRYGYYAYDDMHDDDAMRLWFRIVCRFQPSTMSVVAPDSARLVSVARKAAPGCHMVKRGGVVRYIARGGDGHIAVGEGDVLVVGEISSEALDRLFGSMPCGMCFANASGMAILVAWKHLPHQRFDLFF